MSIQILHKQGMSKRNIARQLGISINTVRKYLREGGEPHYKRRTGISKLDPYKSYIEQRIEQAYPMLIPATVIYREIQAQGYHGKDRQLRYFIEGLKPTKPDETMIRFETEPGMQLQVDWAELRRNPRLAAFAATLGFSRMSYIEFVEDEKLQTLLCCHENAFSFFGGVPKNVLYDNMKTIVVERDAYGVGQHRFQKGLWDFAKHYQFIPKLCRPYRPQTKGKIERFIHYLRYSFYQPLITRLRQVGLELDIPTANQEALAWLREVANARIHGTTGCIPHAQLKEEQNYLQPLPLPYLGKFKPSLVKKGPDFQAIQYPPALVVTDESLSIQHPLSVYDAMLQEGDLI